MYKIYVRKCENFCLSPKIKQTKYSYRIYIYVRYSFPVFYNKELPIENGVENF